MLSNKKLRRPIIRIRYNRFTGSQSGSPEAIANNYDLLTEILVRLPVKSLLRFKSVSKGWHSLISDSKFYCRLFPDISGLIMHKDSFLCNPEHEFIPLSNKPIDAPFNCLTFAKHLFGLKILQSCNGLLLCSSFRDPRCRPDYYVYNPTTKQFVALPPPGDPDDRIVTALSLAFHPTKSPHYKVVCVRTPDPELGLWDDPDSNYVNRQIDIYSSRTRFWRLSGNPFIAHVNTIFSSGVFCNGAIHWINVWDKDSPLYFNVEEEELRELPMPPAPDKCEERRLRYFGESRGHLHLLETYVPRTTQVVIYEIESGYSGWFVKYHVDLERLTIAFPEMIRGYLDPTDFHYYMLSVLCVVREANDEESYMVLHIPDKAVKYNLKDGSFKKICDFAPDEDEDRENPIFPPSLRYFWAHEFIQTLSPV